MPAPFYPSVHSLYPIFCSCWIFLIEILNLISLLFVVLDTAAGVWCDTKSVVNSPRTGKFSADAAGGDAAVELTRRCRHAAAAVGDLIFIYGGLRGGEICPCSNSTFEFLLSFWLSYF